MATSVCAALERAFYDHLHGEWESLRRWVWLYLHASILLATALAGYAAATGDYAVVAVLVPFPVYYLYRRYDHARPEADGG